MSGSRNNNKRFRRQKNVYALSFEGKPEFEGLEVMAESLPLGEFLSLQRLQVKATDDAGAAEKLIKRFAAVITEWNLDDEDGNPVPAEYAVCVVSGKPGDPGQWCTDHAKDEEGACEYNGLCSCELGFVLAIFMAWMQAVASVPNLSQAASNGGGTFPEQSIPMEVS